MGFFQFRFFGTRLDPGLGLVPTRGLPRRGQGRGSASNFFPASPNSPPLSWTPRGGFKQRPGLLKQSWTETIVGDAFEKKWPEIAKQCILKLFGRGLAGKSQPTWLLFFVCFQVPAWINTLGAPASIFFFQPTPSSSWPVAAPLWSFFRKPACSSANPANKPNFLILKMYNPAFVLGSSNLPHVLSATFLSSLWAGKSFLHSCIVFWGSFTLYVYLFSPYTAETRHA